MVQYSSRLYLKSDMLLPSIIASFYLRLHLHLQNFNMSQPAFHQEEREVEVENITLNGEQIPYKKKLAVVFVPPRIVIRLTRPNLDGGPTEWKKCLRFDFLHTWVISNDEAESDKLLVVCGKDRKDKDRYLIKFPNALETEKFLIILKIHGSVDYWYIHHCLIC